MENARAGRFAPTALMLGNLVTGCSVLAPAGMLPELATGLDVSIHAAALLITFGAVILCIGSPLTARLPRPVERPAVLATTPGGLPFCQLAFGLLPPHFGPPLLPPLVLP